MRGLRAEDRSGAHTHPAIADPVQGNAGFAARGHERAVAGNVINGAHMPTDWSARSTGVAPTCRCYEISYPDVDWPSIIKRMKRMS